MLPRRIVIAGGGTAGWLAALMLRDAARRRGRPLELTVIESTAIGTIGVGEGTTALFRQMLRHLGLDEDAFLAATGATVKLGIRHRDWRRIGHHYDGPIDDPSLVVGSDGAGSNGEGPGLDTYAVASNRSVSEAHLFGQLMRQERAPFAVREGRRVAAGPFHHAFHFDQALAGAWLRAQARDVAVVDATIAGVETGTEGIAALALDDGRRAEADAFVDCTGFRRVLIGSLGARWIDYAAVLPVSRAMPFWLDHEPGAEIEPFTTAHALSSGWMWRIPTRERIGCGYVYSDAHIGPDEARGEVERTLGRAIEPRRDIRLQSGRLDRPWIGNCVAVGLASSFLEPLEATSIHGTLAQLMWLTEWLGDDARREPYNAAHARQVDDFRDFIRLHYVSERRDSPFWRDVAATHPVGQAERLTAWRARLPRRADFATLPMGLPHVQEQLHTPVLDGLGLLDRAGAKRALAADPKRRARLRRAHASLVAEYRSAAARCMSHRAFLDRLQPEIAA